ncbi:MAG: hypothetical protein V9G14_08090 [Cypionkella sp.]
MPPNHIGGVSFWYADIGLPEIRRPALVADTCADIAIIGAGFTGLWTAYYLKKAQPDLKVAPDRQGVRRLRCLGAQWRVVHGQFRLEA